MVTKYDYKLFPETWLGRFLLGVAMLGGLIIAAAPLLLLAASGASLAPSRIVHGFDTIEVTYVNESGSGVQVYVDDYYELTIFPDRSETVTDRKISWWFGRRITVLDRVGRVLFEGELDDGDLERAGYRIVIEAPDEILACSSPAYPQCLEAETGLDTSSPSCEREAGRICLVLLGRVRPELVAHLVDYYEEEYALHVTVLTPVALPATFVDAARMQADARELIEHMRQQFANNPGAVLIGLTPVDVFDSADPQLRYLFGLRGNADDPQGFISTFRMDPAMYGPPDDEFFYSRVRKLMSKYIGLMYYYLEPSSDPDSPMFNNILGPDDLDRMDEPLPVPGVGY